MPPEAAGRGETPRFSFRDPCRGGAIGQEVCWVSAWSARGPRGGGRVTPAVAILGPGQTLQPPRRKKRNVWVTPRGEEGAGGWQPGGSPGFSSYHGADGSV